MFQFATFASHTYVFSEWWPYGRVSPFGNLRIKVCLLTPRSLSQATTSFIACNRQGIHHVHLFTCPYNVDLCSCEEQRRYKEFEFSVCRIQRRFVFYFENSLNTLMIDTITTHQFSLMRSSRTHQLSLINLYFFQIVKELKQPLIV